MSGPGHVPLFAVREQTGRPRRGLSAGPAGAESGRARRHPLEKVPGTFPEKVPGTFSQNSQIVATNLNERSAPPAGGGRLADLWDEGRAAGLSEPELLRYRSNLLGADLRLTNFGGGNTSAKVAAADPLSGETVEVCGEGIGGVRITAMSALPRRSRQLRGLPTAPQREDDAGIFALHSASTRAPRYRRRCTVHPAPAHRSRHATP